MTKASITLLTLKFLEGAHRLEWSTQGLGMLRTYLSKEVRLHIWHSRFRVPHVSSIHDHPWDFESEVLCGRIRNTRYGIVHMTDHGAVLRDGAGQSLGAVANPGAPNFTMQTIRCGTGGGIERACELGEPGPCHLSMLSNAEYSPGDSYHQNAPDIHDTSAEDGTVTIVTRTFRADSEHARVFFPTGTDWVSAEPRAATPEEVHLGLKSAATLLSWTLSHHDRPGT